jgi:hypothetical protein
MRLEYGEVTRFSANTSRPEWYWPSEWDRHEMAECYSEVEEQLLEVLRFVPDGVGIEGLKGACALYTAGHDFGYRRGLEVEARRQYDAY